MFGHCLYLLFNWQCFISWHGGGYLGPEVRCSRSRLFRYEVPVTSSGVFWRFIGRGQPLRIYRIAMKRAPGCRAWPSAIERRPGGRLFRSPSFSPLWKQRRCPSVLHSGNVNIDSRAAASRLTCGQFRLPVSAISGDHARPRPAHRVESNARFGFHEHLSYSRFRPGQLS